ncbi:MAG: hypothetical protein IT223_03925 [Crocinitomicaceae bacterium]|nr:hypothetical protein [Crocinitomicaceae bacterium]
MKTQFITFMFCAASFIAFSQVQIDQQIQLTGSGSAAKLTGIDEVSQPSDATSAKVVQSGAVSYAPATGTADNILVSLSPAPASYAPGMIVNFKSTGANTGSATINVNGLGQKTIKKEVTNDLEANDIKSGQMVSVIYDGTSFQLMFHSGGGGGSLPTGACISSLNPVPPAGYTHTGQFFISSAGWAAKSSPSNGLDSRCAAMHTNNRIYVFGGNPYGTNDVVDEYDPVTDTWASKASMLSGRGRGNSEAAAANGKIYVFGGQNSSSWVSMVDEYDPSSNSWAIKTSLPTGRRYLSAATVNNKIYLFGGGNYSPTNAVEEYDPVTDTWVVKNNMATAKEYITAIVYNNLVYVMGGSNGYNTLNEASYYNPSNDTWTTLNNMPEANYYSGTSINGKFYLVTGIKTYEYDPANDTYLVRTPPINTVSYNIPAIAVNNKMYVLNTYNNMEYDPAADKTMYMHCPQ